MIALYIIGGIIVLLIVLAIIAPQKSRVERTKQVNVSPEKAFNHLKNWKNFVEWSPWAEQDPNLNYGFKGEDGQVGSIYWWKGNKKVGEGEMEVKGLDPHTHITTELRFLKPFKATNAAWFGITPDGNGGSIVSWGFEAVFKPPINILMLLMNMDKSVGKDFERGLNRFKAMIEASDS